MEDKKRTEFLIEKILGRSPTNQPKLDLSSLKEFELNFNYPISSHRRVVGKFIVFFKKTIRYFIKPIIGPLINEQNAFNRAVSDAIINLDANYNKQIINLENEIKELKKNARNIIE